MMRFCGRSAPEVAEGLLGHAASDRSPMRMAALNVDWSCFERPGSSVPTMFLPVSAAATVFASAAAALSVGAGAEAAWESADGRAAVELPVSAVAEAEAVPPLP